VNLNLGPCLLFSILTPHFFFCVAEPYGIKPVAKMDCPNNLFVVKHLLDPTLSLFDLFSACVGIPRVEKLNAHVAWVVAIEIGIHKLYIGKSRRTDMIFGKRSRERKIIKRRRARATSVFK